MPWPRCCFGAVAPVLAAVAAGAPQRLIWVDDLIAQFKVESRLWLMEGEDASLGRRTIQYDNHAYCLQAYGTLDPTICKPSYLINGWNESDGTSIANRTNIGVAYDPAGEGDGEHIIGPTVDATREHVYFITPSCATAAERRLSTVWKVKFLLDNQIVPDGSDRNPLTCENASYVFAVNRYDLSTGTYGLVYAATRADFPAPDKFNAKSWKIGFDAQRQRLYWWYNAGGCASVRTCPAPLYYIDVGTLASDGVMPSPVLATTVSDGYGHWYWDMTLDQDGNVYLVDWYHIVKYDPTSESAETIWTESYLSTGWHFTGIVAWPGTSKLIVSRTDISTSQIWTFDPTAASGSQWSELYRQILYEFANLGQNVYNLAVDAVHGLLYAAISGGNSAARAIIELPLAPEGWSLPLTACIHGYSMSCDFYGLGERLVVGHMPSAFSVVGTGKSTNFAPRTADRFPADGTSQIAVLPQAGNYPTRNPCFGKAGANIEQLSQRLKATSRTRCNKSSSTGFNTRHVLFGVDPGDKFPNYLLRDYIAMEGLRTSSDGSFGYDKVGQRRAYAKFMDVATSGGNDETYPGLKSSQGYGHAVKGPAVDLLHGFVYWLSCERAQLSLQCTEWALKRVTIAALEEAAALPDPVDCLKVSCPHSGSGEVLVERHKIIDAATEVLYHQSTQLFPGPDDTRTQTTKLAIDPDAEIVYWLTAKLSAGYSALMYLDVRGWDSSKAPFEPCDVGEVAGHYEYGSWTSLSVACDGTVMSHEIDAFKSLDFTQDSTVTACRDEAVTWSLLDGAGREGWKGCWTRTLIPACQTTFTVGYDASTDMIYYDCKVSTSKVRLMRCGRLAGPKGPPEDEEVYSGIWYEMPPRADTSPSLIAGIAIDDVNQNIYLATYRGNSAQQAVVMLPLPENSNYPGNNTVVHSAYWPVAWVAAEDKPIACLYGHESIPHSSGYGNRKCEYTGERLQWTYRSTGMQVVLPNPEGIKRFYITETSGSLAILPPKPSVTATYVKSVYDWTKMYDMLPHANIKLSKVNGWSYLRMAVGATDLGRQPSYFLCAELCATFWRKGSKRCIGFDWRMSNHDCEDLKQRGKLPQHTQSCGYSNSGLACHFVLVQQDDTAADDFTAWPHRCFTMPTEDRDGKGWIEGNTGYAPDGGWPAGVEEKYNSFDRRRTLLFLVKPKILQDLDGEGASLRAEWRSAVQAAHWFGSSDTDSGKAIWPGDLGGRLWQDTVTDKTNPAVMPSTSASCWSEELPSEGGTDNAEDARDSAGGGDDNAGGGDDNAGGGDDNSGGRDDNSGGRDDSSGGADANSGGNAGGGDDNAGGGDDNSGGGDDNSGGGEDNSGGGDDNSGGGDDDSRGGNNNGTMPGTGTTDAGQLAAVPCLWLLVLFALVQ